MEKYHKYISVGFSLVFVFLVQQFPVNKPIFRIFVLVIAIFLSLLFFYNKRFLEKQNKYRPLMAFAPVLFYSACVCMFFFLPNDFLKKLFLILIVPFGSFYEFFLGNYAESLVLSLNLFSAFFLFSAWSFANFNFPKYYPIYLCGVFFSAWIISRSFFEFLPHTNKVKNLVAVVLGLLCCEVYWAENFLPLYPGVLGFLLFNFFYFVLLMSYYYLFQVLNFKKIQFHLGLIALTTLLVFLATPLSVIN